MSELNNKYKKPSGKTFVFFFQNKKTCYPVVADIKIYFNGSSYYYILYR